MDEEHIASAQALLHMAQSGRCRGLPETGEKMSEPPAAEDAWLAAEQERARTEQLFSLLAEPLVVKRSDLITAAWLAEEDRAELSAAPGKFWQYMGYELQRRKFLRWEEAAMLSELGVVQLTSDGQPCSLQEMRARVLACSGERERQYRLYAYLTRLGYHPVRHGDARSQSKATDYERKIRLDQYASGRKSKRHRAASSSTASPESKLPRGNTAASDVTAGGSEPMEGEGSGELGDVKTTARGVTNDDQQKGTAIGERDEVSQSPAAEMSTEFQEDRVSSNPSQEGLEPPLKRLDFSAERRMFPRISPGDGVVSLQPPPAELLPPGVEPRNQYCLDVAAARRGRRPERMEKDRPRDRYPSCLPVLQTPVRSWAEFKQQAAVEAAAGVPESSPVDPSSAALVPPGWSGSPAELLARLRLAPDPVPVVSPVPASAASQVPTPAGSQAPTPVPAVSLTTSQVPTPAGSQAPTPVPAVSLTTSPASAASPAPVPVASPIPAIPPASTPASAASQAPAGSPVPTPAIPPASAPTPTSAASPVPTPTPATSPAPSGSPAPAIPPAPAPAPAVPKLIYDVYPSDAPFRKSAPPLPEFRVFIVRPDDPLTQLTPEGTGVSSGDGVPVCAAVMAAVGPPAIYTVQVGRLPTDDSVLYQTL